MRVSIIFRFLCFVLLLNWFGLSQTAAQSYDDDDRPVLTDEFCLLLKKIINDKSNNYASLADTVANADGTVPVREDASFIQARSNTIIGTGSTAKYRTVFMIRDTKEALLPSYKNVFSMIKDCLYFDYEFKETDFFGVKEISNLGYKTYENIGTPLHIKDYPQSQICFMIQKNKASGQFELVLEIR